MNKTDGQLQRDVIDELKWDASLAGSEIGVAAREGVITLAGQVDSFAKKYAAVLAAERVAGVRAIAEQIHVVIPGALKRTDTDLAHAIVKMLEWDVQVPDIRVKARVEDGWVWLEGDVDWRFQSRAAERAVRNLTGVRGVTNLLQVKAHVSIPDVKQRIENAFKRSAEIDSGKITVDAMDGAVTLRGTVRTWGERRDAEDAAWSAPGVRRVKDELLVTP